MKNWIASIAIAFVLLFSSGCGNLSPRLNNRIDNAEGKIGNLENMANSLKAEIAKLQTQTEIQSEKISQLQQGLANFQSNNENYGVQILSGPGGIMLSLFGVMALVLIALHYRKQSIVNEKTATILAQTLAASRDPVLEEEAFKAALHTEAEEKVLNLLNQFKHIP